MPRALIVSIAIAMLFPVPLASQLLIAHASGELTQGWRHVQNFRFESASRSFRQTLVGNPLLTEAKFGLALALLDQQPKTPERVLKASAYFQEIANDFPASHYGIASAYYLIRIKQLHQRAGPIQLAPILQSYHDLFRNHPGNPFAEIALVKYAALTLADRSISDPRQGEIDMLVSAADELHFDWARKDLHLILGNALLKTQPRQPDLALGHLVSAAELDILNPNIRADTLIAIANLAYRSRKPAIARKYLSLFIGEFPQDDRTFAAQRMLHELDNE